MVMANPYLVKYWRFDENGTDNAVEEITGHPDDDLAAFGTPSRVISTYTRGEGASSLGNAIRMDGAGDYWRAAGVTGPDLTGAWALEFWIKADAAPTHSYLFNFLDSAKGGAEVPAIEWDSNASYDNMISCWYRYGGGGWPKIYGVEIDDQVWHHIVIGEYKGVAGIMEWYVDGSVNMVSTSLDRELDLDQLSVGGRGGGTYTFIGRMDEVAIYDLSPLGTAQDVQAALEEIAAHAGSAATVFMFR